MLTEYTLQGQTVNQYHVATHRGWRGIFLDEPKILAETIYCSDFQARDGLCVLEPENKMSDTAVCVNYAC